MIILIIIMLILLVAAISLLMYLIHKVARLDTYDGVIVKQRMHSIKSELGIIPNYDDIEYRVLGEVEKYNLTTKEQQLSRSIRRKYDWVVANIYCLINGELNDTETRKLLDVIDIVFKDIIELDRLINKNN